MTIILTIVILNSFNIIPYVNAQCCQNMVPDFSSELTISNLPKLYETVEITLTKTYVGVSGDISQQHNSRIILSDGFDLVSGNLEEIHLWKKGEIIEHKIIVRAMEAGNWKISGGGFNSTWDRLDIVIDAEKSFLSDKLFPSLPKKRSSDNYCFGIFDYLIKSNLLELEDINPLPSHKVDLTKYSNITKWTSDLSLSSNQLVVGEMANFTLTLHADQWPIISPHRMFGAFCAGTGDGLSNIERTEVITNYDYLKDERYYTVKGSILAERIGEWEFNVSGNRHSTLDEGYHHELITVTRNMTDYQVYLEKENANRILFVSLFLVIGIGIFFVIYLRTRNRIIR